ncbi:RNA polymerase sigma factor [Actinacidiphila yeochonensis]|uniref:RNA polymerase sigma factor n=1 Tax=Actinacidiphila yeochonensis TaxID=89050 RepID=UPI00055AAD22|nr:RNA polymerase sigma factor [Actinacidiphila yeochonensis]
MDTSLRARVRAGDPDAFRLLFDEHASVVYRHAVRMTGDWVMGDDIVSLTFLEAWRLRERVLPGEDSLRPWLLGIATNVSRNTARAARRHQAALTKIPPPEAVPDIADEVARRFADADELAAVQKALGTMRRGEREVFTLCVWEGLDAATAAEALGVAVGTVRARLSRARKRLRKLAEAELGRKKGDVSRGDVPGGAGFTSAREKTQRTDLVGQVLDSRHQAARSIQEKQR